jgi:hypothetical protein
MISVKVLQKNKSLEEMEKKYPKRNDRDKSHFHKYVWCIRKLVKEHDLKVEFVYVRGEKNPADY